MSLKAILTELRRMQAKAQAKARDLVGPLANTVCDFLKGRPASPRLAKHIARAMESENDPLE